MSALVHDPRCDGLRTLTPEELRREKLQALDHGDIVGAAFPGGNTLPFLITAADGNVLQARAVTSQFPLTFDRVTGEAQWEDDGVNRVWRIGCMQPLPLEYHQLMLSLDRRMRLGSNGTTNPLDAGDKRVLLFLGEHWKANPI